MTVVTLPSVQHGWDDFDLDPPMVEVLWRTEEKHFWYAVRNRWILRTLAEFGAAPDARVLDVGCGSGSVASALARVGYQVTGIDTAEVLVRKADQRCPSGTFIAGRIEDLPPEYGPFDVLMSLDVLEHLNDPAALLASALRRGRPGALVVVTVPALRSLKTVVDDLMSHKKRYEPGELAALLGTVGLVEIEERGIFRMLTPLIALARRGARPRPISEMDLAEKRRIMTEQMRAPGFLVNRLLGVICDLELLFGFAASRGKAGATLLATARIPG